MKMLRAVSGLAFLLAACTGQEEAGRSEEGGEDMPAASAPATPAAPTDSGAAGAGGATAELPSGVTQEMVQAGSTAWGTSVCASCHGPQAMGVQGLAPSLVDQTWLNGDGSFDSIVQVINTGVAQPKEAPTPMPPKGGNMAMTDEQVRQLAAYIYARSHGG